MINFPDAPTIGQVHKAAGVLYTYNGQGWTTTDDEAPNGNFAVMVSDVPPAVTEPGFLWWENDTGMLWILYDDGESVQWVQATGMMSSDSVGAMDFPATPALEDEYLGYIFNGTGWVIKNTGGPDIYVELAGDVMSGDLTITKDAPAVILDGTTPAVRGQLAGVIGWEIVLGNANANFGIVRHDALGAVVDAPIVIEHLNGTVTVGTPFVLKGAMPTLTLNSTDIGNSAISFANNGAEKWRITTANTALAIGNTIGGTLFNVLMLSNTADFAVAAVGAIVNFKFGGTTVGSISTTGTGVAYNTTSDGRLKEDLKPFDAGDILDKLQVYDFAWKDSGERCHGVVAQEAIDVYPWAVTHTAADWWGVDYTKYIPLLLQEVKTLRERVRQLENVRT
jgi:hypothetical protein